MAMVAAAVLVALAALVFFARTSRLILAPGRRVWLVASVALTLAVLGGSLAETSYTSMDRRVATVLLVDRSPSVEPAERERVRRMGGSRPARRGRRVGARRREFDREARARSG
ncbi:MAG: hypothetical protein M5R36_01465 [Deltaproteobacteria bacterium]|nr:hypothetical protein [Deltaproteobacteria bacterium]